MTVQALGRWLFLALLVALGGAATWIGLGAVLESRRVRRPLPAELRPRFRVRWADRLELLRDRLTAPADNAIRAPWAIERARGLGLRALVTWMGPKRRAVLFAITIVRDGRDHAVVEVRSVGHPLSRRPGGDCERAVAMVEEALSPLEPTRSASSWISARRGGDRG